MINNGVSKSRLQGGVLYNNENKVMCTGRRQNWREMVYHETRTANKCYPGYDLLA
jgi:hypothetical protein